MDFRHYASLYRDNLLQDVIPFWLQHSPDEKYGGYFTCLDRAGKVYDTDKFAWLQFRQIWCFSMLCNRVEQKSEWLDLAVNGAEFMKKYGQDDEGNFYFSLTREGSPLVQPYNIFSDCFAAMAYGQLSKVTDSSEYADIAVRTFTNILKKQHNPKGKWSKSIPGTRSLQSFSLPMILCNLVLELEHLLDAGLVESTLDAGVHAVMETFYRKDLGIILENVGPGGEFSDSFDGRLVNPGHGLEAMWFIMDIADKRRDLNLIRRAKDITLNILEYGWDTKYGGILYFLDIKGYPPQQLEWDQKLWWVHIETLISLLKGYMHTRDERCLAWFKKVHDYTWRHFPDAEHGEWFGYLNRQGEVLLPLKGGKWKGCFHVPRALFQCWKTLEKIEEELKISHTK